MKSTLYPILILFTPAEACAADFNWTGASPLGGGNNHMSNPANWSGPSAPPSNAGTADLIFSGIARTTPEADIDYTINTLRFTSPSGFTLGGKSITLQTDAAVSPFIRNEAAVLNRINNSLTFANSGTVFAQNGNLTFGGVFGTGQAPGNTITLNSGVNRTLTFTTSVGGFGSLSKSGAGTVRFNGLVGTLGTIAMGGGLMELSGAVAGTSGISVDAGTIRLLANNRIPTVPFTMSGTGILDLDGFADEIGALSGTGTINLGSGGLLTVNQSNNTTFKGDLNGAGGAGFTKTGNGTLTLSTSATYNGPTNVSSGAIRSGANDSFASNSPYTIAAGATLDVAGFKESIGGLAGAGTLSLGAGSLIVNQSSNSTFTGALTGSGTLTKAGSGTLELPTANPGFTGSLVVSSGRMVVNDANAFGSSGSGTTVQSGATLQFGSSISLNSNESLQISGSGSAGVGAILVDATTETLTPQIHGNVSLGAPSLINLNRSASFSSNLFLGATASPGTLALGSHKLTIDSNNLIHQLRIRHAITGSGELSTIGSTTLLIESGSPSYTGPVSIQSPRAYLNHATPFGSSMNPVTVAAGSVLYPGTIGSGITVSLLRPLHLAGEVRSDTESTLTGDKDIVISDGAILRPNSTDGTLTIAGTGTLTGTTARLDVITPGTTIVTINRPTNLGTGGIDKTGSGTLRLVSPATYSGTTSVTGGTLSCMNHDVLPAQSIMSLALAGTLLELNSTKQTIGGLSGSGNVSIGTGILTISAKSNQIHSGNLSGAGSVVIQGNSSAEQTFSTANTYTGSTTVQSNGRLNVTADGALSSSDRLTVEPGGILTNSSNFLLVGSLAGGGTITMDAPITILNAGGDQSTSTFSGTLNGTGVMGLTKTGNGMLTVTGATVPAGLNTTVTAGVLRTHSGLPSCPVNIASAGTFEASGNIASLTLSGTFRPGSNLSTGATLTIAGSLAVSPSATIQWRVEDWTGAPGSGSNVIDAQAITLSATPASPLLIRLNVPSSVTNFTESQRVFKLARSSSPISGYQQDAIQIDYFANGPGLTGTWSTRVTDNDLELVYTPPASGETYQSWIAGFELGGLDGPDDDPDNDGIPNGIEYVIGGDPENDDSNLLPTITVNGDDLVFVFRRTGRSAYLNPHVRHSPDLGNTWTNAVHGMNGVTITTDPIDTETDEVTVSIPKAGATSKFARLEVSIPVP